MKCIRCGQEFIQPQGDKYCLFCGNCAEQDAIRDEAENRARQEYERNRQVYEEEARAQHFDDGGGYRYA